MRKPLLIAVITAATLSGCGGGSDEPKPAENLAPVLSAIGDQTIMANLPEQTIGVSVTDEDPGSVTIDISAGEKALLPDESQTTRGQGSGLLAVLSPAADETGQTVVTVTATDAQGLTDSTQFMLTVTPEQKSMQSFVRTTMELAADAEPELVNAVEFMQDAEEDDFSDLFEE